MARWDQTEDADAAGYDPFIDPPTLSENATPPKGPRQPGSEPGRPGEQTVLEREPKLDKPKMYKVLLHNDDYTTMEFVVWVLREVFAMTGDRALALMLAIHNTGRGVAGVYTRDIAETKAARAAELAEENGMPLMCTIEPDE